MIICNLKAILDDKHLTQRWLAKELHEHESTISKLCNNSIKRVDIDLLDAICDLLNIRLHELMLHKANTPGK